jgi:ABC-type uncharacterized transport system permease subunit
VVKVEVLAGPHWLAAARAGLAGAALEVGEEPFFQVDVAAAVGPAAVAAGCHGSSVASRIFDGRQ